ncbi:LytR/AlgR family response regulator transcription factor [Litchfieldia salsa]|uniref:DNA-binding response regulator, LytR/AlgR family n=1 Tax=Litchfieldia salsa TaxID=930152 RepID=A0A1H0VN97_9BACI|nr:LytTR family DNA-binding domain-containing protein [Litchfieldia salsa]SDP79900.1 DNA-binding response regulator, LytR/AlgR family [Litchfieldia salsa]
MIRIAIVEDDEKEASILEKFINQYGETSKVSFHIELIKDAIHLLDHYNPVYDIIFMDIEMPHLNGMEAAVRLRELDNVVTLIFVTNMAKYAVKGYEVDALDFIVKPVRYSTFSMKFKKALAKISSNKDINIVVSRKGGIVCLTSRQMIYIEVVGHRLIYHLSDHTVEGFGSLSDLEKQLQTCNFLRCNSCYLINPQYISHVQGYTVTMTNGDELQISRPRKKQFMAQLADLLGEGKDMKL